MSYYGHFNPSWPIGLRHDEAPVTCICTFALGGRESSLIVVNPACVHHGTYAAKTPPFASREEEKTMLFALRYSMRGKTLRQLAAMKPLGWWQRLKRRVFGVKCLACGVKLDQAYWLSRHPHPVAFDSLVRLICEDRQRCRECALAEERLERERDNHNQQGA